MRLLFVGDVRCANSDAGQAFPRIANHPRSKQGGRALAILTIATLHAVEGVLWHDFSALRAVPCALHGTPWPPAALKFLQFPMYSSLLPTYNTPKLQHTWSSTLLGCDTPASEVTT